MARSVAAAIWREKRVAKGGVIGVWRKRSSNGRRNNQRNQQQHDVAATRNHQQPRNETAAKQYSNTYSAAAISVISLNNGVCGENV